MIRIVSDSSSLYTASNGLAHGIDIAPLVVTINNKSYKEYEDILTKEFIDIIHQGHIPVSSQPAIGDVVDIYNKYPDDIIINISMADGLSGTYNSACMARTMAHNPDHIHVINSQTLCGPQKYLVDLAKKLVEAGKQVDEILSELEHAIKHTKSYLIPNDFDYLVRGGRLSPLVGKIGGLIKLVPVTVLTEDGKSIDKFVTTRTFKKAIQKICDAMLEDGVDSNYKLHISHADKEELAIEAKNIIADSIPGADITLNLLGPAFTTQGGPGCLSIQWIKKHDLLK